MVFKRSLTENPFGSADNGSDAAPRPPVRRPHAPQRQEHATVRFTPTEEKRALILAHAARHRDVDPVQRWSLALGVGFCVIAVGVGWAYAMRETIVHAFDGSAAKTVQELEVAKPAGRVADELDTIMREVEVLKAKQSQKLEALQEAERRLGTAPGAATSSREELFRALHATSATSSVPKDPSRSLPPGVTPDRP